MKLRFYNMHYLGTKLVFVEVHVHIPHAKQLNITRASKRCLKQKVFCLRIFELAQYNRNNKNRIDAKNIFNRKGTFRQGRCLKQKVCCLRIFELAEYNTNNKNRIEAKKILNRRKTFRQGTCLKQKVCCLRIFELVEYIKRIITQIIIITEERHKLH